MSVAVVSRVLNDGTGPVAPQTRARVVEVIERLGFQPRAAARELQQQSTTTIGLVSGRSRQPVLRAAGRPGRLEARARGIHAVLLTNQEDPHLEGESLDTLLGRSVGSVIATPTGGNVDKWRRLISLGVNIVFVDREIDELPGVDVVAINNELSAETATQHMLGLGHERIAFISGPLSTSTGRDRVAGFRKAMAAAGTEVDERSSTPSRSAATPGATPSARCSHYPLRRPASSSATPPRCAALCGASSSRRSTCPTTSA